MPQMIVVGTRSSPLALAQVELVLGPLRAAHPDVAFELKHIHTGGDRDQKTPLALIGGEGLFVKEIEHALLAHEIDLAIHSLKDMPTVQPDGLTLAAILAREDPRDALVSRLGEPLAGLPEGARVGTGSRRREAQLRALRPDLRVVALRGNVDTRLRKSSTEDYDALILAAAGLIRLGFGPHITELLPLGVMLPAVGQGAIAVEVRTDDAATLDVVRELDDAPTRAATEAERSFLRELGGGCHVPIAAHCKTTEHGLWLRGLVAHVSGRPILRGAVHGPISQAVALGSDLAHQLLAQGASRLLSEEAPRE
jgi:hydroxymethylbilane synthase